MDFDKRLKKIEKEISHLTEFIFSFERKSETYWEILKTLVNSLKEELSHKISKEFFDKIILNDLTELKADVKKNNFFNLKEETLKHIKFIFSP